MEPLSVSVIIPCYNNAAYLPEALATVRAQRRPVREVVVVDDASSDGSAAVAAAAGVRCVQLAANGGASVARNAGIAAVSGDLVAFLDADDVWSPDHLSTLVPLIEAAPDVALAFSRVRALGGDEVLTMVPPSVTPGLAFDALGVLLKGNFIPQSTVVARRSAVLAANGYDERARKAEDYRLWLAMAQHHRFVYSASPTAEYRIHSEQTTANGASLRVAAWEARLDTLVTGRFAPGGPERAAAEEDLRALLRWELGHLWSGRDGEGFRTLLELAPRVPGSNSIVRTWSWAARLLWVPWMVAAGVLAKLPADARRFIRRTSSDEPAHQAPFR